MSIGLGIFASVVLVLAVYHAGFRKVLLWTAGIALAVVVICVLGYLGYEQYDTWNSNRETAAKEDAAKQTGILHCMFRLGTPYVDGTRPTGAGQYSNNLQACTAQPDDWNPYSEYGGTVVWDSVSLPAGYKLDESHHVVPDVPPCPVNAPAGFVADGDCLLSGRLVTGFRRDMCIGTMQTNGDCLIEAPPGESQGKYMIQVCPFDLPVEVATNQCPAWKEVDIKDAAARRAEYFDKKP